MRKTIRDIIVNIQKDNIGAFAAQASLFFIMSVIPFLMILLFMIRITPLKESMLIEWIVLLAPDTISSTLVSIVDEVYHNSLQILYVSILFAIFSAAKTIHSLQNGLNVVYEIKETRNWLVLRLWSVLETLLLLVAIILLMVIGMYGKSLQKFITKWIPIASDVAALIFKYRMVLLFFVLIPFLTWIYKVLPNRKASYRSQIPGAVCCSVAWYVFSIGISVYTRYFHGFSFYGSLTVLVVTMFWLYFTMYIFLVCGEINNEFELLWLEYKVYRKKKKDHDIFGV